MIPKFLGIQGIIGLGASLVLSFFLVTAKMDARHWHKQSDQYEKLYKGEQYAHLQTKLNYIDAADAARAADKANAERVLQEQQSINKETTDELEARLADARARADGLRKQLSTAATNPSGPGAASVPSVPPATGGPAEGSLQDRLLATEQAIQLDELIKWVVKQHNVQVSK